jgi:hypothetical protein
MLSLRCHLFHSLQHTLHDVVTLDLIIAQMVKVIHRGFTLATYKSCQWVGALFLVLVHTELRVVVANRSAVNGHETFGL